MQLAFASPRLLAALLAAAVLACGAPRARAADPDSRFPGYPREVGERASSLVDTAGPGREGVLATEVKALRRLMYKNGILSINDVPERVFERAVREGWSKRAVGSLRTAMEVAPLSVPGWLWLVKEDIAGFRPEELMRDLEGLSAACRLFPPAAAGAAAALASFFSAAACWFVVWTAAALFLRARPSLEADIARILVVPQGVYVAPLAAAALFAIPYFAGLGIVVAACLWLLLSTGYVRRVETAGLVSAFLLMAALVAGGGVIESLAAAGKDIRKGGWLGAEGYVPDDWSVRAASGGEVPADRPLPWMTRFAKARISMERDAPAASEELWDRIVRGEGDFPEVLNNRGIARARQGRLEEALDDFERVLKVRPDDAPALWNAYQARLMLFHLERAQEIQARAWDRLQKSPPFYFRPADMEQGEWIPSPMPPVGVLRLYKEGGIPGGAAAGESSFFRLIFKPLRTGSAVAFLVSAFLAAALWRVLSLRVWVHSACRACGTVALISGNRDASEICNACRSQAGVGLRSREERDRRVREIAGHRLSVRIGSLLVPGSGALWAGRTFGALAYAALLSLVLSGVMATAGGEAGALVGDIRSSIRLVSIPAAGVLWLGGAAWGILSFQRFQERYSLGGHRS